MLCLKEGRGQEPTKRKPQLIWNLTPWMWSSSVPILSCQASVYILQSSSHQVTRLQTLPHMLFCSVCLLLCFTRIKNNYFAEREECKLLCARRIQNLLTGGTHLKDKHPVIVNPRTAFFPWACAWNLWEKSLGALIQTHYSGFCLVSIKNI